jgi:hypothetical protein
MSALKNLAISAALGAAFLAASVGPALAQTVVTPSTTEWTTYDAWGNKHKTVYTQLRAHPDWAYNHGYIDKHPELKTYYSEHPGYYTYVSKHHDWYRHHPGWEHTRTTTTVIEH